MRDAMYADPWAAELLASEPATDATVPPGTRVQLQLPACACPFCLLHKVPDATYVDL